MNINVEVKETERYFHVYVEGEVDVYTAPKLHGRLLPLTEEPKSNIVVDLSGVVYLDSVGLGVFINILNKVSSQDGTLKIVGLSERLHKLFSITGIVDIMNVK